MRGGRRELRATKIYCSALQCVAVCCSGINTCTVGSESDATTTFECHVTHMNPSFHPFAWVTAQTWMSHGTQVTAFVASCQPWIRYVLYNTHAHTYIHTHAHTYIHAHAVTRTRALVQSHTHTHTAIMSNCINASSFSHPPTPPLSHPPSTTSVVVTSFEQDRH